MAEKTALKKKKRSDTTGYAMRTNADRVTKLERHKTKGDWRRFATIDLKVVTAYVKWEKVAAGDEKQVKTFITQIPSGMKNVLEKMESQQNRSFLQLPLTVKEYFDLTPTSYKPENFKVSVSFATESKHEKFWYAYCHICSSKKSLKSTFWDHCRDGELPSDVSIRNLMENWDTLNLSWNQQEYLGCLLPNQEEHTMMVNAKMILRPEKHWNSVHEVKKKNPQKIQGLLTLSTDKDVRVSGSGSAVKTTLKRSLPDPKTGQSKKSKQITVSSLLDPKVNFVGYSPKSRMEHYAFGFALNNIHVGVNSNISNETIIKFQANNVAKLREFCKEFWPHEGKAYSILPPRVALNNHNIHTGINAIVEAYRQVNKDPDNPYRLLEKAEQFSIVHDATSYFLKQLNTSMIRVVKGDGTIVKVPFNMKQVSGSFTGEVLCEELMKEITEVKKVPGNAKEKICEFLPRASSAGSRIEETKARITEATSNLDLPLITSLTKELEELLRQQQPNAVNVDRSALPPVPCYFDIATVKGVEEEKKMIHLVVDSQNYPASVCGDSCSVNLKGQRLLDEVYGLVNTFSNCSSHIASGTIRRAATSETMCDENVKSLYNNLVKVLGHFSMSCKSTEMLNQSLAALEMNDVHMLVWGGTRMCGFLDGCAKCSSVLVPLLDTLVTGRIRPDETSFLLSPKGVFLLQLMADIHPVFAGQYLHKTDSDSVISCQCKGIAMLTVEKLRNLEAPKAMEVHDTMCEDGFQNIRVKITANNEQHDLTLNTKVTRQKTLTSHKADLLKMKDDTIECLVSNIEDQVNEANLMCALSCLDIESTESFELRKANIKKLFELYGSDVEHVLAEKWNGYTIHITYKRRLTGTLDDLTAQFDKATSLINDMGRRLKHSLATPKPLTQLKLWQEFLQKHYLEFPQLGDLVYLMLAIPPNSGWVERAYSTLEQICAKRRNKLTAEHLRDMFMLSVLKLEPKSCMEYGDEIKILSAGH